MIHSDTELKKVNEVVGYGVFATRPIAKGTIVYVKDALEIILSPTDYLLLPESCRDIADWYSYIDERGNRIVSWDIAKYVNHSCRCNTISTGYGFEIAVRDIEPGEEITDEYGIFNMSKPLKCCCGHPDCRHVISNGDWDQYGSLWDEQCRQALSVFNHVSQPLIRFLDSEVHFHLMRYLNGQDQFWSVQRLRYPVCQCVEHTG